MTEFFRFDHGTDAAGNSFRFSARFCGLFYELIFTVPLEMNDVFQNLPGIKVIGHTTDESLGCCLITRDGQEITLKAQGWNSLENK